MKIHLINNYDNFMFFIDGKSTNGFHCDCKSGFDGILCQNGKSDEGKRFRKR